MPCSKIDLDHKNDAQSVSPKLFPKQLGFRLSLVRKAIVKTQNNQQKQQQIFGGRS